MSQKKFTDLVLIRMLYILERSALLFKGHFLGEKCSLQMTTFFSDSNFSQESFCRSNLNYSFKNFSVSLDLSLRHVFNFIIHFKIGKLMYE